MKICTCMFFGVRNPKKTLRNPRNKQINSFCQVIQLIDCSVSMGKNMGVAEKNFCQNFADIIPSAYTYYIVKFQKGVFLRTEVILS